MKFVIKLNSKNSVLIVISLGPSYKYALNISEGGRCYMITLSVDFEVFVK